MPYFEAEFGGKVPEGVECLEGRAGWWLMR